MATNLARERRHSRVEERVVEEIARAIRELVPDASRLLDILPPDEGQTRIFTRELRSGAHAAVYRDRRRAGAAAPEAGNAEADVTEVDIEAAAYPAAAGQFDVAVWNRELVTVKNLAPVLREVQRVVRPAGVVLLAVPNLAAPHNRLLLLAGRQPTTLHIGNGNHVRGFTIPAMTGFLRRGLGFEVVRITSVGLAPISAAALPRAFRGLSHSVIWALRNPPR